MHSELILARLRTSVEEKENMANKIEVTRAARRLASSFVTSIFENLLICHSYKVSVISDCSVSSERELVALELANGTAALCSCHLGSAEDAAMDNWGKETTEIGKCFLPECMLTQSVMPQLLKETRLFCKLESCVVSEQYVLNKFAQEKKLSDLAFKSWNYLNLRMLRKLKEKDVLKRLAPVFADCVDLEDDKSSPQTFGKAGVMDISNNGSSNESSVSAVSKSLMGDKTVTTSFGLTDSFKKVGDLPAKVPLASPTKQKKSICGIFKFKISCLKNPGCFQTPFNCWSIKRASVATVNARKGGKKHSLRDIVRMKIKFSAEKNPNIYDMFPYRCDEEKADLPSVAI